MKSRAMVSNALLFFWQGWNPNQDVPIEDVVGVVTLQTDEAAQRPQRGVAQQRQGAHRPQHHPDPVHVLIFPN